jgi:hypothetical protein
MAEITNSKRRGQTTALRLAAALVLSVAFAVSASAFTGPIQTLGMHKHSPAPKPLAASEKAGLVAAALKLDRPRPVPAGVTLSGAQPNANNGHTLAIVKPLVVSGDPNDTFIMLSGIVSAVVVELKTSPGETYVLDVAMSRPGSVAYSCGPVDGSATAHNGHAVIVVSSAKNGGVTPVSISPAADVTMIEIASIEISKFK